MLSARELAGIQGKTDALRKPLKLFLALEMVLRRVSSASQTPGCAASKEFAGVETRLNGFETRLKCAHSPNGGKQNNFKGFETRGTLVN